MGNRTLSFDAGGRRFSGDQNEEGGRKDGAFAVSFDAGGRRFSGDQNKTARFRRVFVGTCAIAPVRDFGGDDAGESTGGRKRRKGKAPGAMEFNGGAGEHHRSFCSLPVLFAIDMM